MVLLKNGDREGEVEHAKKYNGVFLLVSNKEKETFEALRKFRKREWIEDFFEEYKQLTLELSARYATHLFLKTLHP